MILERILKKFSNTKNNGYCTTRKKGTLPFFYNVLQEFTEKLKIPKNICLCKAFLKQKR